VNLEKLIRPIFLIEDNPMDVDLTCRAFQRSQVQNPIQVARDGEEALEIIERWNHGAPQPVYILLDIKLPRVDGFGFLKTIKNHPAYKHIPVIVLTTSNEENDILRAYNLGANTYIVKPVVFEDFMEVAAQIDHYWNVVDLAQRESNENPVSGG
jgi:CheY-like chemotaxis protein